MVDSELGLSDLRAGLVVDGIVPDQSVTIVAVRPMNDAAAVYYNAGDGSTFGQEIIDQQSVRQLSLAQQSNGSSPFDANPEEFRLAAEALRIKYAAQYDPMSAVYSSNIDPLPHQIRAVYEDMRHGGEHVEDQDAAGRGGVHVLRQAPEPHSPGLQQVHQVHEVLHAPAQSVELPHDERVPLADGIEHMVQFGPVRLRARRVIGEQPFTAGLVERVGLQPLVLLQGTHPGIADDHAGSFPTTVRRACRCARG